VPVEQLFASSSTATAAANQADAPILRPTKPQLESRTCTDCGLEKSRAEFVPVAGTPYVYGRCRNCRARRVREHYRADESFREAERARARRKRHQSLADHSRRLAA